MSITRIIAIAVIFGGLGLPTLQAQTLKQARPPAEFPPASYKGKQYVDSRGCIYIRAGIDGNVTWVPRVNRSRKQICGFQPTALPAGSTTTRTVRAPEPELITLEPGPSTASKPAAAPAARPQATAPKVVKVQKPRATTVPRATSKPVPTVAGTLPPAKPTQVKRKPAPAPQPAAPARQADNCSGVSSLSQQYVNKSPDVRCGPQPESPVTYGSGSGIGPQSSLRLTPNTRVVPRHVYDNRQNTQNVQVPAGYRAAWGDDRLNPDRTERGLRPAVLTSVVRVPDGFRPVERGDDRLNRQRGIRSLSGDLQTAQIWEDTLPRRLKPVPTQAPVITLPPSAAKSPAETDTRRVRISTRSAPDAPVLKKAPPRRYVRVATFESDAGARQAAQALARSGLPMRLGTVNRNGRSHRVVLAGPFTTEAEARQALVQARASGFSKASLSN